MLGFSPLASAPLADTGVVAAVEYSLVANSISTGAPVVNSPAFTENNDLTATAITTASPVLGSVVLDLTATLIASDIVTESPDPGSPETDWMASSDVTMSSDMTTYRQALRDVPAQGGFPFSVTWPTKPE